MGGNVLGKIYSQYPNLRIWVKYLIFEIGNILP